MENDFKTENLEDLVIPQWQKDETKRRYERYLKKTETATDVFEFIDELETNDKIFVHFA
jgi:hypothetical protein